MTNIRNDEPPRVFVTKTEPHWDFYRAADYGDVVFMTEHEYKSEPAPPAHNRMVRQEIEDCLVKHQYRPGTDFILLTAAQSNNMVVMFAIRHLMGDHKFLRWNSNSERYDIYRVSQ